MKLADFLSVDLSFATVIYLYGTCLSDKQIALFTTQAGRLKPGTTILTVSYPLVAPNIKLIEETTIQFPWGETTLYIQKIEKS